MFYEMRRKRQLLTLDECNNILKNGTSGVLALSGGDSFPYAVPLSYVYSGSSIYFHSALTGHKTSLIQKFPKASFCVIGSDNVMPLEYTTYFSSVIVFGEIHIVEDKDKKMAAIKELAAKYAPLEEENKRQSVINNEWERFCIIELAIKHISGKKAKELINPGNIKK